MISLTLEIKKSKLDKIICTEEYNKDKLNKLINSSLLQIEPFNNFENEKQQLIKYSKLNGIVVYSKSKSKKYGRVYARGGLGLQSIRKVIRHTITDGLYVDVDIYSAHHFILYQILKQHNKEFKYLLLYISSRESILKDTCDKYNIDKDLAKNIFIRILYGGNFLKWSKDHNITEKPTDFIINFQNEIKEITTIIVEHNSLLKKEIEKDNCKINNIKSSVMAHYLQEIENQILETIYIYCIENSYIKNNNCVLCFDGIMIPKNNYKKELLNEFNKIIKEKFNLDLKFVEKPLDTGYTDEEIKNSQINNVIDIDFLKLARDLTQNIVAEYYYNLEPNKYIRSKSTGWYEYNNYNILIPNGPKEPESLLNNFSKKLQEIFINERNKLLHPIKNDLETEEIYKEKCNEYKENYKNYDKAYVKIGNSKYTKDCIAYLKNLYTVERLDDKLDANNNLLAFDDKLYDITLNKFRNISPFDYITKTCKRKAPTDECLLKQKYIKDIIYSIFENNEMVEYWFIIISLSLFTNKYENFYILVGSGSNGKSLLFDLLKNCIGDYYYQAENTFLTGITKAGAANSTLVNCNGIRILSVSEPNNGGDTCYLNSDFIKSMTGRDSITSRKLYCENITYNPLFNVFLLCNDMPAIKKLDNGMVRRIRVINYPFQFIENPRKEIDRQVNMKLKDEFKNDEQLKNAFIMLLLKYASENINKDFISQPDAVKQSIGDYLDENNPIKLFLDSHIIITKNNKDKILCSDFTNMFNLYNNEKTSSKKIVKDMKFNGFEEHKNGGYRYYYGLIINNNETVVGLLDQ